MVDIGPNVSVGGDVTGRDKKTTGTQIPAGSWAMIVGLAILGVLAAGELTLAALIMLRGETVPEFLAGAFYATIAAIGGGVGVHKSLEKILSRRVRSGS